MKFTYRSKNYFFMPFMGSVGFIILSIMFERFRDDWNGIPYPFTLFFSLFATFLLICYGIYLFIEDKKSIKRPHFITLNNFGLTFPKDKKEIFVEFDDIDKFWYISYDDESGNKYKESGNVVIITKSNVRYDFEGKKFKNKKEFNAFRSLIKSSCNNLSPVK